MPSAQLRDFAARLPALHYRDFRLLWSGELVSRIGEQMQFYTISWHVFVLLRGESVSVSSFGRSFEVSAEALALGGLGLARFVPIILFALVGGVLADTFNRKRLMLITRVIAAIFATGLAVATLLGLASLPLIYIVTAVMAATVAFDNPAQQSIIPQLVSTQHLKNAISLNTLMFQVATITGPALAGLLVAFTDVGTVYLVNAISFGVAIWAVAAMNYRGADGGVSLKGTGIGALLEGFRFTYSKRLIWSTMLLDFFATFFGSARTLLPLFAGDVLGLGAAGYGFLATAQPAGALIASLTFSLHQRQLKEGQLLLGSVALYGVATALFGLSTQLWLAYPTFALTGAGDTISTILRGTMRQLLTPDHLRGRMVGVNTIFFMGGPQLGELEAGLVAALLGAPFAIVSGGLAVVALTGWVAWQYPTLRTYSISSSITGEETHA